MSVVLLLLAWTGLAVGPYLVNGLHELPLAEVASGANDLAGLWPTTTGHAGALAWTVGLFVVSFAPAQLLLSRSGWP